MARKHRTRSLHPLIYRSLLLSAPAAQPALDEAGEPSALRRFLRLHLVVQRREVDLREGEVEEERLCRYGFELGWEGDEVGPLPQQRRVLGVLVHPLHQRHLSVETSANNKETEVTSASSDDWARQNQGMPAHQQELHHLMGLERDSMKTTFGSRDQRSTSPQNPTAAILLTTRIVPANKPSCQEPSLYPNQPFEGEETNDLFHWFCPKQETVARHRVRQRTFGFLEGGGGEGQSNSWFLKL